MARSPEDLARKRDLILDSALALLGERGFHKTTISEVARHAGIGRGTVYWHFESKDDLFYALVERETLVFEEPLDSLLAIPGPALQTIEALIAGTFRQMQGTDALFHALIRLMWTGSEALDRSIEALTTDTYAKYHRVLSALLERAVSEGTVRRDLDVEMASSAILAMFDGMYLQVLYGTIPQDPERMARSITSLVLHGCTPCPDPGAPHA